MTPLLDLSTMHNPHGWPVPPLPAAAWQAAPGGDDGLAAAAARYYGTANLLPVAGMAVACHLVPTLLPRAVVACSGPLDEAHLAAWTQAGHRPRLLNDVPLARALAAATPYVLLARPNGISAACVTRSAAVDAAEQLKKRGGWLIVDESLGDATPDESLAPLAGSAEVPNLIVLRSLDHFFGLPGARVAFICAAPEQLAKLAPAAALWGGAGPCRAAARLALLDTAWQAATRPGLLAASQRLHSLLAPLGEVRSTALFAALTTPHATGLHAHLAHRGILVHHFKPGSLLRCGLPGNEADWQRLAAALAAWKPAA